MNRQERIEALEEVVDAAIMAWAQDPDTDVLAIEAIPMAKEIAHVAVKALLRERALTGLEPKVYFIGGYHADFLNFCQERDLNPRQGAVHVRSVRDIQGRRITPEDEIVFSAHHLPPGILRALRQSEIAGGVHGVRSDS